MVLFFALAASSFKVLECPTVRTLSGRRTRTPQAHLTWSVGLGEISVSWACPLEGWPSRLWLPRAFLAVGGGAGTPAGFLPPPHPRHWTGYVCAPRFPAAIQSVSPPRAGTLPPLFAALGPGAGLAPGGRPSGRPGGGLRGPSLSRSRGATRRGGRGALVVCCCSWCCESGRRAAHPLTRLFHHTRVAPYSSSPAEPRGTRRPRTWGGLCVKVFALVPWVCQHAPRDHLGSLPKTLGPAPHFLLSPGPLGSPGWDHRVSIRRGSLPCDAQARVQSGLSLGFRAGPQPFLALPGPVLSSWRGSHNCCSPAAFQKSMASSAPGQRPGSLPRPCHVSMLRNGAAISPTRSLFLSNTCPFVNPWLCQLCLHNTPQLLTPITPPPPTATPLAWPPPRATCSAP